MSVSLNKLKSFITNIAESTDSSSNKPQLGFKFFYNEDKMELKVRIIGARQLPSVYGNIRPEGYLIKVRLFPGKEKFETQVVSHSWPTYNEEFTFPLGDFSGKFVVFTVYALLPKEEKGKKAPPKRNSFANLFALDVIEKKVSLRRSSTSAKSNSRLVLNKTRTVGAVTYNLEPKIFNLQLKNDCTSSSDIWRDILEISSGLEPESRESKKGSLEVTLMYSSSEDGNNDLFEVTLSRFRCSMNTMMEHEKLKGSLYIKMTAFEQDVLISKWKSSRFDPTISLKIEQQTAILQTFFKNNNINDVRIFIRLMCKNVLGKKTLLGQIELDNGTKILRDVIKSPSTPITKMINLD